VSHDAETELAPADARLAARAELRQSLGWAVLGGAVLIASLRMDRLESQSINPYTVPGLLPGLLGIVMLLLAGLLALRSWRRGALQADLQLAPPLDAANARRIALVLVLCLLFGVVLVGHGLPFWAGAASFVSVAIMSLQMPLRRAAGRKLGLRDVAVAITVGLGAGGAITLVFQQIFLVRLP
jgi:Tripartite tricarboxylate transporter TctB family